MDNDLKIEVKEENRDRYARTTKTKIGQKIITTPNFCVQLQNADELDLFLKLKQENPTDTLATTVVRFVDMNQALWRLHPKTPLDVLMEVRKDRYSLFFEKHVLLIDPSLEYLFYMPRIEGFKKSQYTPKVILNHVKAVETLGKETAYKSGERKARKSFESKRDRLHREFWRDLTDEKSVESNQKRFEVIRAFLQCNLDYDADAILPPVPLIDSEEMLEIAKKMNDNTRELARGKKHCATYLLFKSSVLSDYSLLDKAIRYIAESSKESLVAIKFKHLDLTNKDLQTERDNYRDFVSNLEFFSRTFKNRACIVLENNCQSFVSPLAGFDIVSSSLTNYDMEFSYGKFAPYGKYLHPNLLIHRPWKAMQSIYDKIGALPHNCSYCRSVRVEKLKKLTADQWYIVRRGHVVLFMNEWLGYVRKAIDSDRNVELIADRLANSKIQILKDLLPNNQQR